MLPTARLGKRSPFGALVSSTWSTAATHSETDGLGVPMETAPRQFGGKIGQPTVKVDFRRRTAGESGQADGVPACSSSRPSSSSIDVPTSGRSQPAVDMDELMAAMVLSSLSCSPQLQGPAHPCVPAPAMDGGGELSDGDSSGYWSVGHAHESPASSPPFTEPDGGQTTPPDEGLDMELEHVLFDEPAPQKRRNSLKTAFRCLWPSCGKVLTSTVGIKRHIRTTHLCRGGEHERCSRSEEDFYYTEINQSERPQPQAPPPPAPVGPAPTSPSPPHSPVALSRSAPSSSSSLWQVQSEHSYQAPPPSHVASIPAITTPSSRSLAPPISCSRQGPSFRVRSVSVGEQWLQSHSAPCRRIRGEAKKCRKVYGIEHREQWCTACRWKKACQRFLD